MNDRQDLADLVQHWADSPDSYFELKTMGQSWVRQDNVPDVNSNLSWWRVVIPPKEIELEKGSFYFNYYGGTSINLCIAFKYGTVRKTKELAEQSARRVLESNRLSALVDQIAGEPYEFKTEVHNFSIFFDANPKEWKTKIHTISFSPEKVYGTKETMEKVCQILNDGLFKLELDDE